MRVIDDANGGAPSTVHDSAQEPAISDRLKEVLAYKAPNGDVLPIIMDAFDPKNEANITNLGIAESSLMHDVLIERFESTFKLTSGDFRYQIPHGREDLRHAMAENLFNRHFHPKKKVDKDQIFLSLGCFACLDILSFSLTNPGDGVLIQAPYYHGFDLELSGRAKAVMLPVHINSQYEFDDPKQIEQYENTLQIAKKEGKVTCKVLAIINPTNPTGRCMSREYLIELLKFAAKHNLHVVCDEIYAMSTWKNPEIEGHDFVSLLSIDAKSEAGCDPSSFILYGMSKDFGCNSFRIGAIVTQNSLPALNAMKVLSPWTMMPSATQICFRSIFEDAQFTDFFINENRKRLSEAYVTVINKLKECGIPYDPSNAAQFVWINLGRWIPLARKIMDKEKSSESLVIKTTNALKAFGSRTEMDKVELYLTTRFVKKGVFILGGSASQENIPGKFRLTFTLRADKVLNAIELIHQDLLALEKEVNE